MPRKLNPYKTYGVKLISLFARLLFSNESHSLTDLARMLRCSKQTVLRLIEDIRQAYSVDIEETFRDRRKYFKIKKRVSPPVLSLTPSEITVLQMCKAFTEHLLGENFMKEAAEAIDKSRPQLPDDQRADGEHFAVLPFGGIDYTPHHEILRILIDAMKKRKVCKVVYRAGYDGRSKTFFIKPLNLFSYKDCLYLDSKMARYPGKNFTPTDFDPLLSVHRLENVEITDRSFEYPQNYSFEARFENDFGVMKDRPFAVEMEFTGWAANYVSERNWSVEQKITKKRNGAVKLKFNTASALETISWALSFRDSCRIVKPSWLRRCALNVVSNICELYKMSTGDKKE